MTHHVSSMLETYPKDLGTIDRQKLAECIEACFECAQTCTACADACLAEDMVADLRQCIRLNLDCADLCEVTSRHLTRLNASDKQLTLSLLATCIEACVQCASSCVPHREMHDHCRLCEDACRRSTPCASSRSPLGTRISGAPPRSFA